MWHVWAAYFSEFSWTLWKRVLLSAAFTPDPTRRLPMTRWRQEAARARVQRDPQPAGRSRSRRSALGSRARRVPLGGSLSLRGTAAPRGASVPESPARGWQLAEAAPPRPPGARILATSRRPSPHLLSSSRGSWPVARRLRGPDPPRLGGSGQAPATEPQRPARSAPLCEAADVRPFSLALCGRRGDGATARPAGGGRSRPGLCFPAGGRGSRARSVTTTRVSVVLSREPAREEEPASARARPWTRPSPRPRFAGPPGAACAPAPAEAPWPLTARPEPRGLESRLRGRGDRAGGVASARGVASAGAGRARAGPRSGRAGDAEPSQAERSASCREKHAEPPAACGSASIVLRRRAPRTPPLPRLPQNFFSRGTGV